MLVFIEHLRTCEPNENLCQSIMGPQCECPMGQTCYTPPGAADIGYCKTPGNNCTCAVRLRDF